MTEVFFECSRSGRKWPHLAFGIIFGIIGVLYIVPGTLYALFEHGEKLPGVEAWLAFFLLAPVLWAGFVLLPLWLVWTYIRNPTWRFRIDRSGITAWDGYYAWSTVRWIGLQQSGPNGQVYFAFGRHWRPDQYIPSYPAVPYEEACDVLDKLGPFLTENYPKVQIWD